ncbi:hypothetical protein D3C87_779210 [compost metagenome]
MQRHFGIERAENEADDEGPDGIDADDEAGGFRLAKFLGDCDGTYLGSGESGADKDQRKRDDLDRTQGDGRTLPATAFNRAYLGLGRTLQKESEGAERQEGGADHHARFRKERDCQADGKRGAGNVDEFVGGGFKGECGVQFRPVAEDFRPAGAHHGRNARHGSGEEGGKEQRPGRPFLVCRDNQRRKGDDRDDGGGDEDLALPLAIHQPGDLWGDGGIGQRKGCGDGAGQPIFAMGLRKHGDDADRGHGNGKAGEETGGGKAFCAWSPENFSVWISHRDAPCSEGVHHIHTWRM